MEPEIFGYPDTLNIIAPAHHCEADCHILRWPVPVTHLFLLWLPYPSFGSIIRPTWGGQCPELRPRSMRLLARGLSPDEQYEFEADQ